MKRPPGHSRARWFAQRRNRRGRPFSLCDLDVSIGRSAERAARIGNEPSPLFRWFGTPVSAADIANSAPTWSDYITWRSEKEQCQ